MRRRVLGLVVLASFSVFGAHSSACRSLGEVKEWHFAIQGGEIEFTLSTLPNASDGRTVLSIEPNGTLVPSTLEEVKLLNQVLDEMPSLGYDPRKMDMISTWLQNTEYREGIQRSVSESGKWKSCIGRKYCHDADAVANRYLKSIDAFKSFDDALGAHGLVRHEIRVDDMAVGKHSGRLSCSGLLVISLGKKE